MKTILDLILLVLIILFLSVLFFFYTFPYNSFKEYINSSINKKIGKLIYIDKISYKLPLKWEVFWRLDGLKRYIAVSPPVKTYINPHILNPYHIKILTVNQEIDIKTDIKFKGILKDRILTRAEIQIYRLKLRDIQLKKYPFSLKGNISGNIDIKKDKGKNNSNYKINLFIKGIELGSMVKTLPITPIPLDINIEGDLKNRTLFVKGVNIKSNNFEINGSGKISYVMGFKDPFVDFGGKIYIKNGSTLLSRVLSGFLNGKHMVSYRIFGRFNSLKWKLK